MTHPSIASSGNASNDLRLGPAPERNIVAYEELDARLRIRDDSDTVRPSGGFNPLVSAASRLLSNISRLKPHESGKAIAALRARLEKRIHQFTRQSLQTGVEPKLVSVASYVLCTVADEAVLTSEWGSRCDWASNSLLNALHKETSGGVTFFQLLDRYMRMAAGNIEMLELMYLCLALGFQGRYGATEQGHEELQRLRHDVFRCIHRQRGEVSSNISCVEMASPQEQRRQVLWMPLWLPVVVTLVSLGLMYSAFSWKLAQQREKALIPFQQFDGVPVLPFQERGLAR